MRTFRVGEMVRIVNGDRMCTDAVRAGLIPDPCLAVGDVTRVVRGPFTWVGRQHIRIVPGTLCYPLESKTVRFVSATGDWLEPYWEGKEPVTESLSEILASLKKSEVPA